MSNQKKYKFSFVINGVLGKKVLHSLLDSKMLGISYTKWFNSACIHYLDYLSSLDKKKK
jgi:hypothetical protein